MAIRSTAVHLRGQKVTQDAEATSNENLPVAPSLRDAGREQVAQYIADIVLELRRMARGADMPHLAYFLEMTFEEAFNQSNKGK